MFSPSNQLPGTKASTVPDASVANWPEQSSRGCRDASVDEATCVCAELEAEALDRFALPSRQGYA